MIVVGNFVNPFFAKNDTSEILPGIDSKKIQASPEFTWLISADKIFESTIDGFTEYSKFYFMEFSISKFSLFSGVNSSDSAVCAKDVKIYIAPKRFCATIQSRLAAGQEIAKILLKKVIIGNDTIAILEEKEFAKCTIQSFERKEEIAAFTFRYTAYSDSYQDYKSDGTKLGKAATKINLATWEDD